MWTRKKRYSAFLVILLVVWVGPQVLPYVVDDFSGLDSRT